MVNEASQLTSMSLQVTALEASKRPVGGGMSL
jgi:hypothetical protein